MGKNKGKAKITNKILKERKLAFSMRNYIDGRAAYRWFKEALRVLSWHYCGGAGEIVMGTRLSISIGEEFGECISYGFCGKLYGYHCVEDHEKLRSLKYLFENAEMCEHSMCGDISTVETFEDLAWEFSMIIDFAPGFKIKKHQLIKFLELYIIDAIEAKKEIKQEEKDAIFDKINSCGEDELFFLTWC